jgi:hypothetical protein
VLFQHLVLKGPFFDLFSNLIDRNKAFGIFFPLPNKYCCTKVFFFYQLTQFCVKSTKTKFNAIGQFAKNRTTKTWIENLWPVACVHEKHEKYDHSVYFAYAGEVGWFLTRTLLKATKWFFDHNCNIHFS